jgi:hypothetical protein
VNFVADFRIVLANLAASFSHYYYVSQFLGRDRGLFGHGCLSCHTGDLTAITQVQGYFTYRSLSKFPFLLTYGLHSYAQLTHHFFLTLFFGQPMASIPCQVTTEPSSIELDKSLQVVDSFDG